MRAKVPEVLELAFAIFFGLFSDESEEMFCPVFGPPTTVYGRAGMAPREVRLDIHR